MCCAWMQTREKVVCEYRAKKNVDSEVCDWDILTDNLLKTDALYMKVKEETKKWKKQQP